MSFPPPIPWPAPLFGGTIAITGPFSGKPIIQKTVRNGGAFGFGSGPVPVALTLSKMPAYLEYQVIDATTAAVIEAWQPYNGHVRPGTQTISPIVSCRLGWNYIQFRANSDNASLVTSTVQFGVGDNILAWGQSLAVTKMSTYITADPATIAGLGLTVSPYCSMFCAYGGEIGGLPPVWAPPADATVYNSAFAAAFLAYLVTKLGYNVGFVGYAFGSTTILQWLPNAPGGFNLLPTLLSIIAQGITGWAVEIREQGHAEAASLMPGALYKQLDQTVRNALELVNTVPVRKIFQTIPSLGPYQTATPASVMAIRTAMKQQSDVDYMSEYVDDLNATLWSDLVHPSQAGGILSAQNCYRAVAKLLGAMPIGSLGPYISGTIVRVSSAPTTIVIPVTQRGGTALVAVGTPANQFGVYLATDLLFASPLSVTAAAVTATSITLTLASDPGVGLALNVIYRPGTRDTVATTSSGIFDNKLDSDGITTGRQLVDPSTVMPVAGTVPAITVNTPATTTSATLITLTGSYFGMAPNNPTLTVSAIAATTSSTAINVSGSYTGGPP